jgi:hypothetical protein
MSSRMKLTLEVQIEVLKGTQSGALDHLLLATATSGEV